MKKKKRKKSIRSRNPPKNPFKQRGIKAKTRKYFWDLGTNTWVSPTLIHNRGRWYRWDRERKRYVATKKPTRPTVAFSIELGARGRYNPYKDEWTIYEPPSKVGFYIWHRYLEQVHDAWNYEVGRNEFVSSKLDLSDEGFVKVGPGPFGESDKYICKTEKGREYVVKYPIAETLEKQMGGLIDKHVTPKPLYDIFYVGIHFEMRTEKDAEWVEQWYQSDATEFEKIHSALHILVNIVNEFFLCQYDYVEGKAIELHVTQVLEEK